MVDKVFENSTFPVDLWSRDANKNCGTKWRISFEIIPKTGARFYVFKGKGYHGSAIVGKSVVVKALKHHCAVLEDFNHYRLGSEVAQKMAKKFNRIVKEYDINICFVKSATTTMNERASLNKFYKKFTREEAVIVEDKISGKFEDFISNRGALCKNDKDCSVLTFFAHFTYHESQGAFVVCGLKGERLKKANGLEFTLSNPAIHSIDGRFGAKDKRDAGIHDFRYNHKCNKLCKEFLSNYVPTEENDNGSDELK